jgi:pimeloyl-ACP methyl ester carboxylesterase
MYYNVTQAPPFDRSEKNGVRCARYADAGAVPRNAFDTYETGSVRDLRAEKPVSNEVFEAYREQFAYDARPLEARVEARDSDHEDWVREKVSFSAAYGGERVIAQLFLPRRAAPPFQVVVYFPGAMALNPRPSDVLEEGIEFKQNVSFLVKSGRAVLGLLSSRTRPEVDAINYVSHVRMPVLMLQGRYDLAVPLETEARPMFERLGTPDRDKRLYVVDTDHWIPRTDLIRESLAWLDKYLGPVEPAAAAKP